MSKGVSAGLLLLSVLWLEPAVAQVGARQSAPAWVFFVRDGHVTAHVNRVPLRLVLDKLAREASLRVWVSGDSQDHPVTAHFRALPVNEAVERLLAGFSYALVHAPAPDGEGSPATPRIAELLVLEKASATKDAGISAAPIAPGNVVAGPTPSPKQETTPEPASEWTAALEHPDKKARIDALQRWAEQGAATPLNPLTHALVDPDESVRAKAQELVEGVLGARAGTR